MDHRPWRVLPLQRPPPPPPSYRHEREFILSAFDPSMVASELITIGTILVHLALPGWDVIMSYTCTCILHGADRVCIVNRSILTLD